MYRFLLPALRVCALALLSLLAPAGPGHAAGTAEQFLEPEEAFRFSARMIDGHTAAVSYRIADGYYMYRDRFRFSASGATLGDPVFPRAQAKFDPAFGKQVDTYRREVTILLPVRAGAAFSLTVLAQGCSDAGLCYLPQQASATLQRSAGASAGQGVAGRVERVLASGRLPATVALFLLLGLGLSLTPCVLPMVPILSAIIIGEAGRVSRRRGLLLSATYALGMAIVYTALGVAAGLAGEGLAGALQNRWMLGGFGILMGGLALSMFGLFELQAPAALQQALSGVANRRAGGKLAGVFAMGAVSALIVGPCVAAPLAGALVYIGRTHDVVMGGAALFSLAAGMSVPLLLVGASAGALLPRAGAWMEAVKKFFGVVLLATAWWLVTPVLPAWLAPIGWAALAIGYAFHLLAAHRSRYARGLALGCVLLGGVQLSGALDGAHDDRNALRFTRIKTAAQLDAALAAGGGKPVLLDFYADWCVSCKEMEKLTFADPRVQARLRGAVLLRADVAASDADDRALLRRFGLFGPPAIIQFDGRGQELARARVIGFQDAQDFLDSLAAGARPY